MTFAPALAHVGHWWVWILYLFPVLIVLGASARALIEQRREDRASETE
jgi:hypothetical protein